MKRTCASVFCVVALVLGAVRVRADLMDNLAAYYPFDGSAIDASGNGNDGTVHGATLTTDRFGTPSSAFSFDGYDDFIELSDGGTLHPPLPVTIAAWVRMDDLPISRAVFSNCYHDNAYFGVDLACSYPGEACLVGGGFMDGGGTSPEHRRTILGTCPLPAEEWHHVAIVIRGAVDMETSVDGVVCSEFSYSGVGGALTYDGAPGSIGKFDSSGFLPPDFFSGEIDDIHFFSRALGSDEIVALYGPPATAAPGNPYEGHSTRFSLGPPHPNPFANRAVVQYVLPAESTVILTIHDVTGRRVRRLFNGSLSSGSHSMEWDGTDSNGQVVGAGVYFLSLESDGEVGTQAVVKLRQ